MSLVNVLKRHVEDLKVRKQPGKMTATEQRLNFMTAVILNPKMSKEQKDKILRRIVANSQIEKILRSRGVPLNPIIGPEKHDHR